MSEIQEYVCGFLFFNYVGQAGFEHIMSPVVDKKVLLILKDRPAWQAGKYNGIGGKVEVGEKHYDAMVRECYEECGLKITNWKEYCVMKGEGFRIQFFKAYQDSISQWQQKTSEALAAFSINKLPPNLINSNRYLIPMALENDMVYSVVETK